MVKIKFITSGANSAFGGFNAGDMLTCSEAMAAHLVGVKCAKYADVPPVETPAEQPAKQRKAKK